VTANSLRYVENGHNQNFDISLQGVILHSMALKSADNHGELDRAFCKRSERGLSCKYLIGTDSWFNMGLNYLTDLTKCTLVLPPFSFAYLPNWTMSYHRSRAMITKLAGDDTNVNLE